MNETQPLVSIVTPSFNQAAYLEEAMQSVFHQEYPEIEYLVVDGGSTDGSVEIIQRYGERLAWWVSEPDRGQAEAINKGLSRAKGEIVTWLNSDDIYLPGAVAQAVAALQSDPSLSLVFGDAITIDNRGRFLNTLAFGDWNLGDLLGFRVICQPAVFMRRSAFRAAGGLNPDYHFMLDHDLWLRMALQGPVRHEKAWWAAARYHLEAKNVSQAANFSKDTIQLTEEILNNQAYTTITRPRVIRGGASRLAARYYLDGGLTWQALKTYLQAFWLRPCFTLQHWHRITYALFSLAGFKELDVWYHRWRSKSQPEFLAATQYRHWPGLDPATGE